LILKNQGDRLIFRQKTYHQRGEAIMAQGVLPFKYEAEKKTTGMTALAGLPAYLDLAKVIGLSRSIQKHLKIRTGSQGWTDSQMVLSLILLNLAGGDCVEDIKKLEGDDGFCEILKKTELHGLQRKVRRALLRRWRKERTRTIANFQGSENMATLDMDATLIASSKESALYCYKGYKSYQPLNTWWAEQGIVLHTEFRDGNVPAGFEQLRVLKQAIGCLPEGIERVRLRSDTAGYQHDLLRYCATGKSDRFGVIEFAIGCDVTPEFKKAVAEVEASQWRPMYKVINGKKKATGVEWAEVCFVPSAIGHSKKGPEYRYLAKREALVEQRNFPEMNDQISLPFPTMNVKGKRYKVFGIVTNMDWEGEKLIHWLHERCGKSEEAHAIMKDDLAGGSLPSDDFGENAAWWWIMILAFNLNAMMKRLALGKSWVSKRMKAVRFSFINLAGRVIRRSRSYIIRLTKNHPSLDLLIEARKAIMQLRPPPSG
jgi:hypothetical protein